MKFCKKCGAMMLPKKDAKKQPYWHCGSCGWSDKKTEVDAKITTKVEQKEQVVVVDSSQEESTLPSCEAECPKCNYGEAYYWIQQTRASDEPETKFLKCVKCKHTWRDYS